MTEMRWGSALHVGQVRQVNQDHVLTREGLFAVADGMGGHRAGEVASEVAVDTLRDANAEPTTEALVAAVQKANASVVTMAREDPELRGMGTTVSALALVRDTEADRDLLAVVNVGDSRCYLLRAESEDLEQVTEDHSLVATLVRQGQLTEEEAAVHPQRNILTRALGIDGRVLVDSWELEPVRGDRYLLCSDGLFNEVEDRAIASVLRRLDDPDEAAAELVRLANEHGGRDNISVVIADVVEADTEVGSAPGREGRIIGVVHGEDRAGASQEQIPARPATPASAPTDEAAPPGGSAASTGPGSRLSWRVVAFVAALCAIVGGTYLTISWLASSTYYVGVEDGEVAIFQGRPGGTLWVDASLEEIPEPAISASDVPAEFADDVDAGREFSSLDDARAYVENIRNAIDDEGSGGEDDSAPDGSDAPTDAGGGIGGAVSDAPTTTEADAASPSSTTTLAPASP